jgi:hypothetical protein
MNGGGITVTDELEARLRRADPARAGAPVRPADAVEAEVLRRTIMTNDDEIVTATGAGAARPPWRRQPVVLGAVGAAAAAAIVITVVATTADEDDPPSAGEEPALTFELAPVDQLSQSCVPVADIEPVAGADAFAGTVVALEGRFVVLDATRWYTDGTAERVRLRGADQSVALDGVDFVVGEDYLVTAADDVVQVCGVSGPASPELEALYDEWYG